MQFQRHIPYNLYYLPGRSIACSFFCPAVNILEDDEDEFGQGSPRGSLFSADSEVEAGNDSPVPQAARQERVRAPRRAAAASRQQPAADDKAATSGREILPSFVDV